MGRLLDSDTILKHVHKKLIDRNIDAQFTAHHINIKIGLWDEIFINLTNDRLISFRVLYIDDSNVNSREFFNDTLKNPDSIENLITKIILQLRLDPLTQLRKSNINYE